MKEEIIVMSDSLDAIPPIPRRKFLKKAGLAAAGVSLSAAGLAACGDPTVTSAPATTAPISSTTTTAAGASSPAATVASSSTKQYSGELRLLQWVSFVPAADNELKRQAEEWGKKNNVKVTIDT